MATISLLLLCFLAVGCVSGAGYRPPRPPFPGERCGRVYCQPGEVCQQERPICFNPRAYCPTISRCVKNCAAVICAAPRPGCTSVTIPGECCPRVRCKKLAPATCEDHQCPLGQVCQLVQPQCIRAPCPTVPECVPQTKCSGPGQLCECRSDFDCPQGEECKFNPIRCFRAPCPEGGNICMPKRELIPTCDGHQCPLGQVCELVQPQCIRAPCPPIPQCVPLQKCSGPGQFCKCRNDYDCPRGEECKPSPIQCIRAPCPEGRRTCRAKRGEEKPGVCPPPSGSITTCEFKPGRNCLTDEECLGQKKCCSEGCGKECKIPLFYSLQQGNLG